jgi:hypothetical protein
MSVMQCVAWVTRWFAFFAVTISSVSIPLTAHAVPAYARQTGENIAVVSADLQAASGK